MGVTNHLPTGMILQAEPPLEAFRFFLWCRERFGEKPLVLKALQLGRFSQVQVIQLVLGRSWGYLKSLHNGELRSYSQASKHISVIETVVGG